MPTPKGRGLSGSANGHKPGAEQRTRDRVFESQEEKRRKAGRRRAGTLTIEYDLPFQVLLREAAERRGIAANGYARRAIAAFIALDLGMEFEEVVQHFARPTKPGEVLRRTDGSKQAPSGTTVDDGQGFGSWRLGRR